MKLLQTERKDRELKWTIAGAVVRAKKKQAKKFQNGSQTIDRLMS